MLESVRINLALSTLYISVVFSSSAAAQGEWSEIARDRTGTTIYAGKVIPSALPNRDGRDLFKVSPLDAELARQADNAEGNSSIWIKMDHSNDRTEKLRSTLLLYAVDCHMGGSRLRQSIGYMPDGRVAYSRNYSKGDNDYVVAAPGSSGEAIVNYVCGRGY